MKTKMIKCYSDNPSLFQLVFLYRGVLKRFSKILTTGIVICLVITGMSVTLKAQSNSLNCVQTDMEREQLLSLDYQMFDQTKGEGFRSVADRDCFEVAAELILEYSNTRGDSLTIMQKQLLTWHAGQMFAYANNYDRAKDLFLLSMKPDKEMEKVFPWNAYVKATVAFIDGDLNEVKAQREQILSTPTRANLHVVDALIERFGRTYLEAYRSASDR